MGRPRTDYGAKVDARRSYQKSRYANLRAQKRCVMCLRPHRRRGNPSRCIECARIHVLKDQASKGAGHGE